MSTQQVPGWHSDFQPDQAQAWKVPAMWMLDQVSEHLQAGEESMTFAVKDGKLYVHAFKPLSEQAVPGPDGQLLALSIPRVETWAEEFPPL